MAAIQAAGAARPGNDLPSALGIEDLRALPWSSIDNDTSRDLDQIEVAERVDGGVRLRVAIGDVAALVPKGSPIDEHAREQTQTIYTAVRNFPMLPQELSTGLTSLNEDADRLAVLMSFTVSSEGELKDESVGLALVRNRAQMAYSRVGPWLEGQGAGSGPRVQETACRVLMERTTLPLCGPTVRVPTTAPRVERALPP